MTPSRRSREPEFPLSEASPRPVAPEAEPADTVAGLEAALGAVDHEARQPSLMQELFIPIHGFVELTSAETKVVNHPALQRLGSIYQLGQAHLVFRGATHTRLEHCIGVVHVANQMVDAINKNQDRARRTRAAGAPLGEPISERERVFIRLAALLHDVGHLPAGHTLEDELAILGKHDGCERLKLIFEKTHWPGLEGDSLGSLLDREFSLGDEPASPSELVTAIVARDAPSELAQRAGRVIRLSVCRDIVGNTICADLLDYLNRDWYHIGKPQYFESRLYYYMEIRHDGEKDTFVVSLGQRPKLRTDAVSAILRLLESRYELAETVLFHRTKCAAAAMLERGLQELAAKIPADARDGWRLQQISDLLTSDDQGALDSFLQEAIDRKANAAVAPLSGLRQRRLYKSLFTAVQQELTPDRFRRINETYLGPNGAEARLSAVRLLESDFGLPVGSLALYCPDKAMNAKIARVRIHVNGAVDEFAHWEEVHQEDLGGGHLQAQLNRFQRLWRVHFVIREEVLKGLSSDMVALIRQAIHDCVLGLTMSEETVDTASKRVATALANASGSPYLGSKLEGSPRIAARSRDDRNRFYPSDAPSLRLHFSASA